MTDSGNETVKTRAVPATSGWLKKSFGALLVVLGLILHLIPLFPASWIIVLGLELLGIRMLVWGRLKTFVEERGVAKARRWR